MLKLNRMTDYGAVILSVLASQWRYDRGESLSAVEIATKSGLGQASVAKILKILAASGLVSASRGKNGGYRLTAPPEEISVSALIEAMEGPIALTACVETSADPCAAQNSCFLSGNWEHINRAINGALSQVTIAHLIDPESHFRPASEMSAEAQLPLESKHQ
jgi:FeS assembly SUF system regulator